MPYYSILAQHNYTTNYWPPCAEGRTSTVGLALQEGSLLQQKGHPLPSQKTYPIPVIGRSSASVLAPRAPISNLDLLLFCSRQNVHLLTHYDSDVSTQAYGRPAWVSRGSQWSLSLFHVPHYSGNSGCLRPKEGARQPLAPPSPAASGKACTLPSSSRSSGRV